MEMNMTIDWQPIETMPDEYRDGRFVFLLAYMSDDPSVGRWNGRKWEGYVDGHCAIESQSDFRTVYMTVDSPDYWLPVPTRKTRQAT
jgi:hypothetical protein